MARLIEGMAEGMARLETETAFQVLARAAELSAAGRDVINLGIGQPDFPTPEHVVEAAVKALRDGAHGYTEANGTRRLREAVAADLLARRGVEVSPDRIVITPGGKPTMFLALLMLGGPGAEILHPDPGFPIYRSMIAFTGATPVPVPVRREDGFAPRAAPILERMTPRTRMVIVNSPGNPTGGVMAPEEVDALAAGLAARPDVALLSDEIYARMLYDGAVHRSLLAHAALENQLILLDGWSKTYAMTGWRLGFGVWPARLAEPATRLCVNSWSCVNAATQAAGVAALEGPQDAVDAMMAAFDARRRLVVAGLNALPGVSCPTPEGAFYAFADMSAAAPDGDAAALQRRILEEAHVATIAGASFGAAAPGCIRFSYANSTAAIEEALARIGRLLAG